MNGTRVFSVVKSDVPQVYVQHPVVRCEIWT